MGALNWSPKKNWVEKRGGLPPHIEKVALAIMRERGLDRQTAIKFAIAADKRWAKSRRVHQFKGNPRIRAAKMPAIVAAAARWEAMKGSKKS